MASEASIHAEIEAAGLRSGLVPMTRPALNPINPDSSLAQFAHDIEAHLAQHAVQVKAQVNVHILAAGQHGLPGDVVQMTGAEAAQLLALGHGEVTAAKPHRVPRLKSWQSQETVLS